jgi:HAE1 family hydrophobic/amphiphilic exporter-1
VSESPRVIGPAPWLIGVLPLALSTATGAELHCPLAIVYIGGFFFAVLLRLFVVPVLYEILGALSDRAQ